MKFQPCNRYLLIQKAEKTLEVESLIQVPEGFKPSGPTHEMVTIKAIAAGTKPPLAVGDRAVVLGHMIEEVDFGEGKVYLILENHVVGIVREE